MSLATLVFQAVTDMDYVLNKDGSISRNERVEEFFKLRDEMRRLETQLDQYYVCATLASVFKQNPWLGSMTLEISVESEYNDEGGYYDWASVRVSSVSAHEGVAIPEEFAFEATEDGFGVEEDGEPVFELDEEAAAENLTENYFQDEGESFKDALRLGSGDSSEITINRHDIEDLLKTSTISAKKIFARISAEFES